MSARFLVAFCLAAAAAGQASSKDLADQCVGGKWDEILAQSGILHARKFPEFGLTEKLAFECPSFVHQVLSAESLGAESKRKVFSEVESWPHEKVQVFYLKLKMENHKRQDGFWRRHPQDLGLSATGTAQ